MKTPIHYLALIALPLVAASVLSSCVSDGYAGGGGGYVTYATLPPNYSGNAYYYNNRYYAGGRYESGRYSYGGRAYTTRYFHNGQYLYGGNYRQHSSSSSYQPRSPRSSGSSGYGSYQSRPRTSTTTTYQYGNRSYSDGRRENGRDSREDYYRDSTPSGYGQGRDRGSYRGGNSRASY